MTARPRNEATVRLTRRSLSAALTGFGLATSVLTPSALAAQAFAAQPGEHPVIDLVPNLFTRVGTTVRINGEGPFVFVIDTGAGRSAVSEKVAQALALPDGPSVLVHGITAATLTRTAIIDELSLARLYFRDLNPPILPEEKLGAHGLIGLDILSRFRLGFDIPGRSATLDAGRFRVVTGGTDTTGTRIRRTRAVTARKRFGQLILTETLADDVPVAAFIDTGAQYSIGNLALYRSVATRRPDRLAQRSDVSVFGVTGQSVIAAQGDLRNLRLGRADLGPTPLLFADLHCFDTLGLADQPTLLVGADLIGRFRKIVIDFPGNRIQFDSLLRRRA